MIARLALLVLTAALPAVALSRTEIYPMPTPAPVLRLIAPEEHARRLELIPDSTDGTLEALRKDRRIVFYDRDTTPPIFQDWWPSQNSGGTPWPGLMGTKTNHSANKSEPFGNANREFPWAATAGLKEGDPVLHFVIMEKPARMAWKTVKRDVGLYDETYLSWTYADGTVFGELILVTDPETQKKHTAEVRLRRKNRGEWNATAYRPFPSAEDLETALEVVPREADRRRLRDRLGNPWVARHRTRNPHPRKIIDVEMTIEELPEVEPETVRVLLKRPFQSALGTAWRETDPPTHAPTTKAAFHIVPTNYDAGAIEVSTKSCSRCHDTAAAHVNDLEPFRDWYGRSRGADTIFSLHPFRAAIADEYGHNRRDDIFDKKLLNTLFTLE